MKFVYKPGKCKGFAAKRKQHCLKFKVVKFLSQGHF